MNLLDRFWDKIELSDHEDDQCWYWTSSISKKGYGKIWKDGKCEMSYRVSYELFNRKIEKDMQIDHLCRNRVCVNPSHLEQVTLQVNISRGDSGINFRKGYKKSEYLGVIKTEDT